MEPLNCQGPTLRDIALGKTDFRPSRPSLREFLFDRANQFLSTDEYTKKLPRKLRREHARALSKRLAKQVRTPMTPEEQDNLKMERIQRAVDGVAEIIQEDVE